MLATIIRGSVDKHHLPSFSCCWSFLLVVALWLSLRDSFVTCAFTMHFAVFHANNSVHPLGWLQSRTFSCPVALAPVFPSTTEATFYDAGFLGVLDT